METSYGDIEYPIEKTNSIVYPRRTESGSINKVPSTSLWGKIAIPTALGSPRIKRCLRVFSVSYLAPKTVSFFSSYPFIIALKLGKFRIFLARTKFAPKTTFFFLNTSVSVLVSLIDNTVVIS